MDRKGATASYGAPRVSSETPSWAASKSLTEVDKVHDSDQTALLRAALALFENCDLPPGVLDEIRKIVPPHRPPTRKATKVSREQIVLNMKKKLEKEEQELRERKSALELARKLAAEKQQKVLEQATVVSDLKLQLVEIRQDIANNPTPEVSEDEGGEATPVVIPLAPPRAVTRPFLPKTLLWIPRVMTWMRIFSMRSILVLQRLKERVRGHSGSYEQTGVPAMDCWIGS